MTQANQQDPLHALRDAVTYLASTATGRGISDLRDLAALNDAIKILHVASKEIYRERDGAQRI